MILIVARPGDPTYGRVAELLSERDVRHVLLDGKDFPTRAGVTLSYGDGAPRAGILHLPSGDVAIDDVSAVWYRRFERPVAAAAIADAKHRRYVELETTELLEDLWTQLAAAWFPAAPWTIRRAGMKTAQLRLALELGLDVPRSLVTTDRARLLSMFDQSGGRIISKLSGPSFARTHGKELMRYTEPVGRMDLAFAPSVAMSPILFQEYVDKRFEVRATVVRDEVLTAEIHSQAMNHTGVDFRNYDVNRPHHAVHRMPADTASRCVALTHRLGLEYAAIDLIVTDDGKYVFLEANPIGEYLWLEDATGLPISRAIADALIAKARS